VDNRPQGAVVGADGTRAVDWPINATAARAAGGRREAPGSEGIAADLAQRRGQRDN
jgi:hypothetical protein